MELSISDQLLEFGIVHERDENSPNDGKHTLRWVNGDLIGRRDAHEAVELLNDLRFGVDEPDTEAAA